MEFLRVIQQSVASLAALFFLSRMIAKRQISELNLFDYINSITIGSIAAEFATNLEEWYKPFTAMIVFAVFTVVIDLAECKSVRIRRFVNGKPTVLYEDGVIKKQALMKQHLDLNEFLSQCRAAGYFNLNELECAIMENSGRISFLPKSENRPATPKDMTLAPEKASLYYCLISDGHVQPDVLKQLGYEENWLMTQLHSAGIGQISSVFYACCDKNGNFQAYPM